MEITRTTVKNWRNFRNVSIELKERTYIIGPNAAGKSNFLDIFRFMYDITKSGGGLQKAIEDRGGITKLRCLQARNDPEISLSFEIIDDDEQKWEYSLSFKAEGKGKQRILVSKEFASVDGTILCNRPTTSDKSDTLQLTQTHLEQIMANKKFRPLHELFSSVTYLHLVPQLLKFSKEILINKIEDDPFGQGFLERLAATPMKTRDAWLKRIQYGLSIAVPQFKELKFEKDDNGIPHLEARYEHWRPNAGWQKEDQFSDGTLRLIGLLWSLLEKRQILLLEEPELSLNNEIVRFIPEIIENILKGARNQKQVIMTTHSYALLDNNIDANSIILLEPSSNGTMARMPSSDEIESMEAGFTPAEIMLPRTFPIGIEKITKGK
ncbi:AAA family ATPase [Pectobacterium brasiliense]|uniref:AAA family ATPase n=1 Tax=Pectobacterium brasiliense TaxID=180957 RepID=UPI0019694D6E|nr:ATP-binding protein [Pectobacterium brasiliense]MBN3132552.1 AAA family ATPase [Pectobacterium brasiliense]